MRNSIRSISTCFMLSFLLTNSVSAEASAEKAIIVTDTLESVKVTASRIPLSLQQAARPITILNRTTIEKLPVNTVNDLLKFAAGVDVRQRGGNGMQTDISIRGGTADQIGLYIDGIPVGDAQTGHNAFSIPLEISDIERIEILEGPAGRTYGPSSMMGSVNIITRKGEDNSVSARLEGGSYGTIEAGARLNFRKGRLTNTLSGGYGHSDGFSRSKDGNRNADGQNGHLFYRGRYDGLPAEVSWHFGFIDKDFGSNTFYSTASDEQFEHVRKFWVAIQAATKGKIWKFKPSVYWNRSEDRFEFFRGQPEKSPYNFHQTDAYGLNLNNEISWAGGLTAFGAEMRNEGVISTNLGEPLNEIRPVPATSLPEELRNHQLSDGSYFQPEYRNGLNRTNISFYLEHTVLLKDFTLSAGVAAVKNTGNEMNFRFYPGADISWRFSAGWALSASYNTSLRMPTFTELYYSVGGHQADKYLKPEQMQAAEISVKYHQNGIRGGLSVYYGHGTDLIDWIKEMTPDESSPEVGNGKDSGTSAEAPWTSVNHGAINSWGLQPYLSMNFREMLGYEPFVRSFSLSYNYLWQDKQTGAHLQSKYVLEYLRNKLTAQLDLNLWNRLYLTLSARWQDRCGNYMKEGELVAYQPYTLLDAQLSWDSPAFRKMPAYKIFICANNLLDRTYYDYGNIPQPGIWLRAGISCTFGNL